MQVAEKKLGTVDDLITLDTENMGTITGFPAVTGPLPPNIPLSVDPRTGEQEYPPILEDRELLLVPKGGPSLFGKKEGPLEGLRSDGVATEKEMRRLQKEIDRLEMRGAGVQLP